MKARLLHCRVPPRIHQKDVRGHGEVERDATRFKGDEDRRHPRVLLVELERSFACPSRHAAVEFDDADAREEQPVLEEVEEGDGGASSFQFAHLSFQEGLFAQALKDRSAAAAVARRFGRNHRKLFANPWFLNALTIGGSSVGATLSVDGEKLELDQVNAMTVTQWAALGSTAHDQGWLSIAAPARITVNITLRELLGAAQYAGHWRLAIYAGDGGAEPVAIGYGDRSEKELVGLSLPSLGPFVFELVAPNELLPLRVRPVVQVIHALFADSISAFASSGSIEMPIDPGAWTRQEPTFVMSRQPAKSGGNPDLCRLTSSFAPASWVTQLPRLRVEMIEPTIPVLDMELCGSSAAFTEGFGVGMASGLGLGLVLLAARLICSARRKSISSGSSGSTSPSPQTVGATVAKQVKPRQV